LGAFALVGRRQRHDLAHARVEPLSNPLDDAALARSGLEENHQLELLMDDPVLEFDKLLLQPQQFLEVSVTIKGLVRKLVAGVLQPAGHPAVVNLQFQLFVDQVDRLVVETLFERAGV
jgi:hypothetical protein